MKKLLLVLIAVLLTATSIQARIGEEQSTLERRIREQTIEIREDAVEEYHIKNSPYGAYIEELPLGAEVELYYKNDDPDTRPSSDDLVDRRDNPVSSPAGWVVHIMYDADEKSIMEFYQKSSPINEYELELMLQRQGDGSPWVRKRKEEAEEGLIFADMGNRANKEWYEREDGKVRVVVRNDALLFFTPELDSQLKETSIQLQRMEAPVSVEGF